MTKPDTPSAPSSAGTGRNVVAVDEHTIALTLEDRLRIYWQRNGKSVIALVGLIVIAILAKGAWDYRAAQREQEIEREYAAASTPEQLKAFAGAHVGHMLTGITRLRLADADYAAGKSTEAVYGYEDAIATIKSGPLVSRARLGLAMAKVQSGKTADGEAALKQLATDANEPKGTRVEAAYQLASLANVAGRADDVKKYSDLVMQIDPTSPWLQRALMLRASLAPAPTPAGAVPEVKFPATGK